MNANAPMRLLATMLLAASLPATTRADATSDTTASAKAQVLDGWVVPPVVASGTRLPAPAGVSVAWRADGPGLRDDVLVNDDLNAHILRLTGTIALAGGERLEKRFTVRLLGTSARSLVAYSRVPTDANDANQPIVAHSLHLAIGRTAAEALPLNANYGVVFASGDYIAVDRVALHGLIDPAPFHFADGSIGVIAKRIPIPPRPDMPTSEIILFRAPANEPARFKELGTLELGPEFGDVVGPHAVWDTASRRYVLWWRNAAGMPVWTIANDLLRTRRIAAPLYPGGKGFRQIIVRQGNVAPVRTGSVATVSSTAGEDVAHRLGGRTAASLPIGAGVTDALVYRFGRITNTRVSVAPQRLTAERIADLTRVRATLDYSDGSTASRAVDWNVEDLRRLTRVPRGTYEIRGMVRQPAYPAIFAYNRADPAIHRYTRDGVTRYLFVATDDTGNDNVGSRHLPIRVADSIAGLSDEAGGRTREVDLLNRVERRDRTADGRTIAGCYWAPELHEIGGRLSILFAPCFNRTDADANTGGSWRTVEAHIMQLRPGGDPATPNDWSRPVAVRRADGSPIGRRDQPANISLDMSYFEAKGRGWYIWSQRYLPAAGPLGDPLIWIAAVNPSAPTRLVSEPRPIVAPDLSFEENLAEGGFVLRHGGRLHLIYSASGVSPTYVVGGVSADAKDDPSDMASWRKWSSPLQKSVAMPAGVVDYRAHEQGPGHGAFTTDEDGNTLYVYHSWGNGVGGNGRDTRVRRVHWASDGRPVLDMTADEEVAPANRMVVMRVSITL